MMPFREIIPGDTTSEKITTLVAAASYWSYHSGMTIMLRQDLHSIATLFSDLAQPVAFVWLCIQTSHWVWKNLLRGLFASTKKGDRNG